MGRPLNKKYFGNRNLGTGGYEVNGGLSNSQNNADDRIGGEGVASVNLDGNEGRYTNSVPTATFSAPSIPGGVTATASAVHVEALAARVDTVGSGYAYNDTLTLSPDGTWTAPQMSFTVTQLRTVTTSRNNGGSAIDNGDAYEFSGSYSGGYWATPLRVSITNAVAGVVQAGGYTVTQAGVWVGAAAPSTTAGATLTQVAAGSDWNGTGLVLNLTSWGVHAVTVAVAGDHTEVPGNVSTSCTTAVSPAGGTGAKLFVEYGVIGVDIGEKGSGYISTADAAVTFSAGDIWTATSGVTLTTDSGGVNNQIDALNDPDNQDNAIIIYANTSGSGSTGKIGDIIKQTNARSYKIKTADGIGICRLSTDSTPATGYAYLIATDSGGATYYVTKLTSNKAVLVNISGTPEFTDGTSVKWTFGSAVTGYSVTVENA